jgi:hypothetical protein
MFNSLFELESILGSFSPEGNPLFKKSGEFVEILQKVLKVLKLRRVVFSFVIPAPISLRINSRRACPEFDSGKPSVPIDSLLSQGKVCIPGPCFCEERLYGNDDSDALFPDANGRPHSNP